MKFSTREDVEAPVEFLFDELSDFQFYERLALRRGADVRRLDEGPYKVGSAWDVAFTYREKKRELRACVEEMSPHETIRVSINSSGVEGLSIVEPVSYTHLTLPTIA